MEQIQRRMIVARARPGAPPEAPMHRVVAAALNLSQIEAKLGIKEDDD